MLSQLSSELGSSVGLDWDARSHRCAKRDAANIFAFCGSWLSFDQGAEASLEVLKKLLVGEADFTDGHVNDSGFVSAVLDTGCSLDFLNGGSNVVGDSAVTLVGSSWAEDSPDLTDLRSHLFRSEKDVEVSESSLDLCDQVIAANSVGSSCFCLSGEIALSKNSYLSDLTGAEREVRDSTNVLVALLRVDAESDSKVNALNELGSCGLLDFSKCGHDIKGCILVDGLGDGLKARRVRILS